jgi:citrate/tricarballylate utilization protein
MSDITLPESDAVANARRSMEVCNACRYCEGYCAVFPAMELRREFSAVDLGYLANLCHGCRACFYACQYAPPHQFGVNLPQQFSEVRAESYVAYAWPQPLARLFRRNGTVLSIAAALGVALLLVLVAVLQDSAVLFGSHTGPGAFYRVIPLWLMVTVASVTFLYALLAMGLSVLRFWRAEEPLADAAPGALWTGLRDALTLRYLGGGGHGCNDTDGGFSDTKRRLHHAMFYGFMFCFAATTVAAIYQDIFGWAAPYGLLSVPVVLGTLGGVGMVVGGVGMIWLKVIGDAEPAARRVLGGEYALLFLLVLVAATGLLLLMLRATPAMGIALAVHLGFVLALFLLMPYSKFVHGLYRAVALWRAARERK